MTGRETVLFIDEVHRFSKTQQDALLPAVENRWVTLVAATTENPYFSIVSPLLSRSLLLTLASLDDVGVEEVVRRAVTDERGLGGAVEVSDEAMAHLLRVAGGDARRALTALEAGAGAAMATAGPTVLDVETLETAVDRAALRYDRDGDQHYDVISAFIKSVRGSDVDAALHYLARMIEAGEDPRFIARRLVILASEDIGLADPTSLLAAVAAADAVALIGMPEARINLAQAVIHLSLAPKSNAVVLAVDARSPTSGPGWRAGAAAPARRPLRRRRQGRLRDRLRLPARPARRGRRAAVPAGRRAADAPTTGPPGTAPSRGWPTSGRSSAPSSAAPEALVTPTHLRAVVIRRPDACPQPCSPVDAALRQGQRPSGPAAAVARQYSPRTRGVQPAARCGAGRSARRPEHVARTTTQARHPRSLLPRIVERCWRLELTVTRSRRTRARSADSGSSRSPRPRTKPSSIDDRRVDLWSRQSRIEQPD